MPLPILGLIAEELGGDIIGDSIFQDKGTPESRAIEDPDSSEFKKRLAAAAMLKRLKARKNSVDPRRTSRSSTKRTKLRFDKAGFPPVPGDALVDAAVKAGKNIPDDSLPPIPSDAKLSSNMDNAIKVAIPEIDMSSIDEIGEKLRNMDPSEAAQIDEVIKNADPESEIGKAIGKADQAAKKFGYSKSAMLLMGAAVVYYFLSNNKQAPQLPPVELEDVEINQLPMGDVEDDLQSLDEESLRELELFLNSTDEGRKAINTEKLKGRIK